MKATAEKASVENNFYDDDFFDRLKKYDIKHFRYANILFSIYLFISANVKPVLMLSHSIPWTGITRSKSFIHIRFIDFRICSNII